MIKRFFIFSFLFLKVSLAFSQDATADNSVIAIYFVNLSNKDADLSNKLVGLSYYANTKFGRAIVHSELFYTKALDRSPTSPDFSSYFGVKEGFGGTFRRGARYNVPFAFYAGLAGTKNDAEVKGGFLLGAALEFRYFITNTNAINIAFRTDYFINSKSWAKGVSIGYSFAGLKKVKK